MTTGTGTRLYVHIPTSMKHHFTTNETLIEFSPSIVLYILLHNMQNALHENPFCFIHLQHKCWFSRSLRTILLLILLLFLFRAQNNIGPFTTPSQGTSHLVENLKRKRVVSNWRVFSAIITLRRGLCGLLLGRKSTPLQLQSRIWFLICFQIPQIYSANLFLQLFGIVFCLMQ